MLRNFLLTGAVFVLSVLIFATTVQNLDPLGAQKSVALLSFFLSLFFGVGALGTFVFFFASEVFSGRKLGSRAFLTALRRGILLSVFVTSLMVLQLFRFLSVVEVLLLAAFLIFVELICRGKN